MKPITLAGNNSFGLKHRLAGLTDEFISEYGELALERLDASDLNLPQIIEAVQSLPFLAERKLVILRDLSANKPASEAIEQILGSIAEPIQLVIVEPNPDKRTIYYKTLTKKTNLESFEEVGGPNLGKWLIAEAADQGGALKLADANYLIDRVGPNQQLLASEISKLVLYNPHITRESIDMLCEPAASSKIFDLLDAAFAGNRARTLKLYEEQRAQNAEPQAILAMIAWQLRNLVAAKLDTAHTASRDLAISPYVLGKARSLANKIDLENLQDLVKRLLQIDYQTKTKGLDLDEALRNYLVTIS